MRRHVRLQGALVAALVSFLLSAGCGEDSPTQPKQNTPPRPASDFRLADVNTSSPTFGDTISPRDYRNSVSAWYFGHST